MHIPQPHPTVLYLPIVGRVYPIFSIQPNCTADGKVQHWNKVRQRLDMLSGIRFYFFFLFFYDWVSNVFRYAVVGVMEEFQTSLKVLQVQDLLYLVGFENLFAKYCCHLQEILPRWFRGAVKTKKGKAHRCWKRKYFWSFVWMRMVELSSDKSLKW